MDPKRVDNQPVEIGHYYEATKDIVDDRGVLLAPRGTLFVVLEMEPEKLLFYSAELPEHHDRITTDWDSLRTDFAPVADGLQRRHRQVADLTTQISDWQGGLAEAQAKAMMPGPGDASPAALPDAESHTDAQTGALSTIDPTSVAAARTKMAGFRSEVKKFEMRVKHGQSQIQRMLAEQVKAIEAKVHAAREMARKLTEVVHTFDVYLGRDEEIVRLSTGKAAPASDPIVIRQLTLYMDEESLIAADRGGMDFRSVATFDAWVSDPAHLRQVLPEDKGVVAIKPRRTEVKYTDDPFLNQKLNESNLRTFWLVRNGENLYRIASVLDVGDHIVPTEDEYLDLFQTRVRNYDANGNREDAYENLRPGSREYADAMEKADNKKRHYMRILLFLQGLVDRTNVFRPFPHGAERINLINERLHPLYVRYVYDADPKRLFGTGRPSFEDWLDGLTSRLEPGHRVIGHFSGSNQYTQYDKASERVHPKGAGLPHDLTIHTIERREGENFVFLFEYDLWNRQAKTRASYRIRPGDTNIIPIDFAELDDVHFYLHNRVDRRSYMTLFPLLKRVIATKEKEAAEEAPFAALLAGEIMKEHGVERQAAEAAVPDLVRWWKFKNRTHRALTSDDSRALRMIVDEFGLRAKKDRQREAMPHDKVVAAVLAEVPDAIFVGHKIDREYVVLRPMDTDNVWVSEATYRLARDGSVSLTGEWSDWRVIDGRRHRWHAVHRTARYDAWLFDARSDQHLTGPEKAQIIEVLHERANKAEHSYWDHNVEDHLLVYRPLSIWDGSAEGAPDRLQGKYVLEVQVSLPDLPPLETGRHPGDIRIVRWVASWTKDGKGRLFIDTEASGYGSSPGLSRPKIRGGTIVKWDEFISLYKDDIEDMRVYTQRAERLRNMSEEAEQSLQPHVLAAKIEADRLKFMAEEGDPELWEMELEQRRKSGQYRYSRGKCYGEDAASYLIYRGVDANGKTLRQCIAEAKAAGFAEVPDADDTTPMDAVVSYTVLPEIPGNFGLPNAVAGSSHKQKRRR